MEPAVAARFQDWRTAITELRPLAQAGLDPIQLFDDEIEQAQNRLRELILRRLKTMRDAPTVRQPEEGNAKVLLDLLLRHQPQYQTARDVPRVNRQYFNSRAFDHHELDAALDQVPGALHAAALADEARRAGSQHNGRRV